MDADGLPLVGPGINFSEVEPINQKRMLAFLNHFISHTAGFLNRFSVVCEEKLENMTIRIQRLETTLSILEAKLLSIPGLDDVTVSLPQSSTVAPVNISNSAVPPSIPVAVPQTTSISTTDIDQTSTLAAAVITVNGAEAESLPPDTTTTTMTTTRAGNKASDDPRYAKFFKLLSLKIPKEALQQRMVIEGLDPSVLNNPDAVIDSMPTATAPDSSTSVKKSTTQQHADSDDDFSDDGHSSSSLSQTSDSDFS